MSFELSREQYTSLYGPTTGDAIRLADTELFAHCLLYTSPSPRDS